MTIAKKERLINPPHTDTSEKNRYSIFQVIMMIPIEDTQIQLRKAEIASIIIIIIEAAMTIPQIDT